MHEINASDTKNIHIGMQGEDERTQIRFPLADIMEEFPGGSATLMVKRPEDTEAYPATETEMDETDLVWTVQEYDLVQKGEGHAQVVYTVQGGAKCKSRIWSIHIDESLTVSNEAPPDWEDWVSDLLDAAAGVDASIAAAESTLESAVTAAETAQGKAETAKTAAETAKSLAEFAMTSASAARATAVAAATTATSEAVEASKQRAYAEIAGTKDTSSYMEDETMTIIIDAPYASVEDSAGVSHLIRDHSKGWAGEAKREAEYASGSATAAAGSATAAAGSATAAASSASAASGSATSAAGSATAASGSATAAYQSETAAAASADEAEQIKESIDTDISELEEELAPVIKSTASGEIASFADGADGRQIDSLVVNIEPVQDLHGYDNPWPAGGGKNLLDPAKKTIDSDGKRWRWYYADGITLSANQAYTLSVSGTSQLITLYFIEKSSSTSLASGSTSVTYTPTEDVVVFLQAYRSEVLQDGNNVQLEKGSSPTAYAPYSNLCPISGWTGCDIMHSGADTSDPTVLPISWQTVAGTVYGGQDEVIGGGLSARMAEFILDSSIPSGSNGIRNITVLEEGVRFEYYPYRAVGAGQSAFVISDRFKTASAATGTPYCIQTGTTEPRLYMTLPSTYNTEELIRGWFAENNTQIVYTLAEPVQYQLAPNQLSSLLGQNNIFADCGSIESVQYSADTKTYVDESVPDVPVQDVKVNGTSVVNNGVANVPIASSSSAGVGKVGNYGIKIYNGYFQIERANDSTIKNGIVTTAPIVAANQHISAFYGFAKAAGDSTQSSSSNAVGTYTDSAKSAIHEMLNGSVSVSGTTPAITALPGIRYVCGEVATLTITLPASGIVDVVFESGSTATVLTITPPTGVTVKWAGGFDPSSLDTNTTYEINVADGLGVAASWI